MSKNKPVSCLTLSQSVVDKAKEMMNKHPDDLDSKTKYFEVAGIKLWKSLKEKERRESAKRNA